MCEIIIDTRNHDGLFGESTSYFSGHYLVNGEEFDDEGNTDRGNPAWICDVLPKILEILEDTDADELDLDEKIQDGLTFDPTYEQGVFKLTGTSVDNLKVEELES